MTVKNHYGIEVSTDAPIMGAALVACVNLDWLVDQMDAGICITDNTGNMEIPEDEIGDTRVYLIGAWIQDADGNYIPDHTGTFAAIFHDGYALVPWGYVHVIWSSFFKHCPLCRLTHSPFYLGCGDLPESGHFLTYSLPPAALED